MKVHRLGEQAMKQTKKIPTQKQIDVVTKKAQALVQTRRPLCMTCLRKMTMFSRTMVSASWFSKRKWDAAQARFKKSIPDYKIIPYEAAQKRRPIVDFRCTTKLCAAATQRLNRQVPMADDLLKLFLQIDEMSNARTGDMHAAWHRFTKAFGSTSDTHKWKWKGYDLIQRVQAHAEKHPEGIEVLRCDDGYHAGSRIVVVHHELPDFYWGTTFVVIPQCTGEDPVEFFFYGDHAEAFSLVMKAIVKKHHTKGDRT